MFGDYYSYLACLSMSLSLITFLILKLLFQETSTKAHEPVQILVHVLLKIVILEKEKL